MLLLLLVATLLLRDGDLFTDLILVFRVEGFWATDLWVLVVLVRTVLLWVLFSGFLYVLVLLVTVLLRGVWVTVLLATVFSFGDLTTVDLLFTVLRSGNLVVVLLLVTVRLPEGLALLLRIDLLSIFLDLSIAVLPATFVSERFDLLPVFFSLSFL